MELRLKTAGTHEAWMLDHKNTPLSPWTRSRVWITFCHGGRCDSTDAIGNLPGGTVERFSGGVLNGLRVRT